VRRRRCLTLLCTTGLVAWAIVTGSSSADAGLPGGANPVPVSSSAVTTGVDGHLHPAASISGTVVSAVAGVPVSSNVTLFKHGHPIDYTNSDGFGTGSYVFHGLAAAPDYVVCADLAIGGSSSTGYLNRCYQAAAWNGRTVPAAANLIPLASGQQETGIDVLLPSAAAIKGTVRSPSGTPLVNVDVVAHNRNTGQNFSASTFSDGRYEIRNLTPASHGYSVCFDGRSVLTGIGFLPRCYGNVAWSGNTSTIPAAATPVSVTLGSTRSGISSRLPRGGAISGTVRDAQTGNLVPYAEVTLFSSSGTRLRTTATDAQGHYVARGLAAATGYRVCERPHDQSVSVSYLGECWRNVAWNGRSLPAGTRPVSASLGQTHTGINLTPASIHRDLGSISGHVREQATMQPLHNAEIVVFTSGGSFVAQVLTSPTGRYQVMNLRASSTGYVVCVKSSGTSGTVPTPPTGWAPRCYADAQWSGGQPPSGATRVSLNPGQQRTGINIALHFGGAISGAVTESGTGTPIGGGVKVQVFTSGGAAVAGTYSAYVDGTYSIVGLSPSTGYIVCFDGRNIPASVRYRPQCYSDVAWNGVA
jgi:large repetitive protein